MKKLTALILSLLLLLSLSGCLASAPAGEPAVPKSEPALTLPTGETAAPQSEPAPTAAPGETEATALPTGETEAQTVPASEPEALLSEDGSYTTKEDVALYLHLYGHLPDNFITKREAQDLGWSGGSLEPYAPGKCIGGNRFGNYEGLLPEKEGRSYTECDIDTLGASSRGAKRIVFSNDGLIYYTADHYKSFTLLYGEE